MTRLKSPYPYMGGKSRIADEIWKWFGNPSNYVEPFFGSGAILLARPAWHWKSREPHQFRETIVDINPFIINFARAVAKDPDAVASYADYPVIELDMHARHQWLMRSDTALEWRKRMKDDPDYYDAKVAGWWLWGAGLWIGSGWCQDDSEDSKQIPELDHRRGVHSGGKIPRLSGRDGVHSEPRLPEGRPQIADAFNIGRGVHAGIQVPVPKPRGIHQKRPNASGGNPNKGIHSGVIHGTNDYPNCGVVDAKRSQIMRWMRMLSDRYRYVRVLCKDWKSACDSDSTMTRLGETAVLLDPPYPTENPDGTQSREAAIYTNDRIQNLNGLRDEVLEWCRKWGPIKNVMIAVCGYDTDGYAALEDEGWTVLKWKANGGYANAGKKKENKNSERERIWFSPHCLNPKTKPSLFD